MGRRQIFEKAKSQSEKPGPAALKACIEFFKAIGFSVSEWKAL
jgi:hypothetical protein